MKPWKRPERPARTSRMPALRAIGEIALDVLNTFGRGIELIDTSLNTLDQMGVTAAVARQRHTDREARRADPYRTPARPAPPLPVGITARAMEMTFREGLLTPDELAEYKRRTGRPA